jgi:DNA mismatch endonuclease (patch repair protein)
MDTISPEERSAVMRLVREKNTNPEMVVRRIVHSMGYRYRLHCRTLPGCPDLVFPSKKKVIFVHGCFWHRHKGCGRCRTPSSRQDYWIAKLEGNKKRDLKNQKKLLASGWSVLVIWECEIKDREGLSNRLREFLKNSVKSQSQA